MPYDFGMFQCARQKKIISGAFAYGDSHARAIEILNRTEWRRVTDDVCSFDQDVRGAEKNFRGAHRIQR